MRRKPTIWSSGPRPMPSRTEGRSAFFPVVHFAGRAQRVGGDQHVLGGGGGGGDLLGRRDLGVVGPDLGGDGDNDGRAQRAERCFSTSASAHLGAPGQRGAANSSPSRSRAAPRTTRKRQGRKHPWSGAAAPASRMRRSWASSGPGGPILAAARRIGQDGLERVHRGSSSLVRDREWRRASSRRTPAPQARDRTPAATRARCATQDAHCAPRARANLFGEPGFLHGYYIEDLDRG